MIRISKHFSYNGYHVTWTVKEQTPELFLISPESLSKSFVVVSIPERFTLKKVVQSPETLLINSQNMIETIMEMDCKEMVLEIAREATKLNTVPVRTNKKLLKKNKQTNDSESQVFYCNMSDAGASLNLAVSIHGKSSQKRLVTNLKQVLLWTND